MRDFILITCEHGGNRIPAAYRSFFQASQELLDSHHGYDIGALVVAKELSATFAAPLITSTTSRLLIDLNRSIGHPNLHSEAVRAAPKSVRQQIIEQHYVPYRSKAEGIVSEAIANGSRAVHISSHSFTPELDGKVRNCDIGLLYDPARAGEVALCERWKAAIEARAPHIRVRRNYPYAGTGDGLTRLLRSRFTADCYVGIELEVNQKYAIAGSSAWMSVRKALIGSLQTALRVSEAAFANRPSFANR
ncbi:MAG: N-formylglutamate amidohydrolase [Betaproteobacteria bacterium]